jgi:hypothetical protein
MAKQQAGEAIPKQSIVCLKLSDGVAKGLEAGASGSQANVVVCYSENDDREATCEDEGCSYANRANWKPRPKV